MASHTYPTDGTYTVILTLTDQGGEAGSVAHQVTVGKTEIVFIGAGDIAGCAPGYRDEATAAIVARYPTATVYTLGDNVYPAGTSREYSQCYNRSWGKFKDRTYPAPGNHDYLTTGAAAYFAYFGSRAGPAGRGYYSYDLGNWHVISLDSEIDASPASAQAAWLKRDLASHPATCTLAYWHKPLFTSGAVHPPYTEMLALFTRLYDAGADIVLSGHNHQYERFSPQAPTGARDQARGVREFVVGTGGARNLYDFAATQPNSEVRHVGRGVLKLALGPANYAWEFVPIDGSTFSDSGRGSCHGAIHT